MSLELERARTAEEAELLLTYRNLIPSERANLVGWARWQVSRRKESKEATRNHLKLVEGLIPEIEGGAA